MAHAELPRRERGTIRLASQTYGHSRDGTALEVWLPPDAEPRVLVVGGIHGDEPETTTVLSSALRSLPPWALRCALVLAANPDGLVRGTRANANGVDLNRNLPTSDWSVEETTHRWGLEGPSEVALGTGGHAGSEPETRALIGLVERLRPEVVVAVHAPLACVDDPGATPLGSWLAELGGLPLVNGVGYPTPGSLGTWGHERRLPVITYELPPVSVARLLMVHGPVFTALLAR